MIPAQQRILVTTLSLTAATLLTYPVIAAFFVGFSFGSFALYGLFPMLTFYFGGILAYRLAGNRDHPPGPKGPGG